MISDKKEKEDSWVLNIAINDAINQLNEREKKIIKMRYFECKTQMETASEMGISQAQVSRLEKCALKQMRKYL